MCTLTNRASHNTPVGKQSDAIKNADTFSATRFRVLTVLVLSRQATGHEFSRATNLTTISLALTLSTQ